MINDIEYIHTEEANHDLTVVTSSEGLSPGHNKNSTTTITCETLWFYSSRIIIKIIIKNHTNSVM